MGIRNFWIDCEIAGRESHLEGGPRAKDGWMDIDLYQRQNGGGKTEPVLKIMCRAYGNQLHTVIKNHNGDIIDTIVTER